MSDLKLNILLQLVIVFLSDIRTMHTFVEGIDKKMFFVVQLTEESNGSSSARVVTNDLQIHPLVLYNIISCFTLY